MSFHGEPTDTRGEMSSSASVASDVYADARVVHAASEEYRLFPLSQARPDRLWILASRPSYDPLRSEVTNVLLADCEARLSALDFRGALTSYSILVYYFDYIPTSLDGDEAMKVGMLGQTDLLETSLLGAERNTNGLPHIEHEIAALRIAHAAARKDQLSSEMIDQLLRLHNENPVVEADSVSEVCDWVQAVVFKLEHSFLRRDEVAITSEEVMQEHDLALLCVRNAVVGRASELTNLSLLEIEMMLETKFGNTFSWGARRLTSPLELSESLQLKFPGAKLWGVEVSGN